MRRAGSRKIGTFLEDGTLYAYGAYQPDQDGFFKARGFAFASIASSAASSCRN